MQKMASNKHASFGSGEKLLRCAGSLFTFLGLSLLPRARQPQGSATFPALLQTPVPSSASPCAWRGPFKGTSHSALPTDAPLGPVNGPPNLSRFPVDPSITFFPPFFFFLELCDCRALAGGVAGFRASYLMVGEMKAQQ